jgi:quercetin dioxygenase-like cupin family protein
MSNDEPTTPDELRRRLRDEGLEPQTWGNGAGDTYAEHEHDYDKVLVATEGSITFHLRAEGRDLSLDAGERLELPAGTAHAATVGPRGVTCLEAHLPAGSLTRPARHRAEW